jgi:hypothetical protein
MWYILTCKCTQSFIHVYVFTEEEMWILGRGLVAQQHVCAH